MVLVAIRVKYDKDNKVEKEGYGSFVFENSSSESGKHKYLPQHTRTYKSLKELLDDLNRLYVLNIQINPNLILSGEPRINVFSIPENFTYDVYNRIYFETISSLRHSFMDIEIEKHYEHFKSSLKLEKYPLEDSAFQEDLSRIGLRTKP